MPEKNVECGCCLVIFEVLFDRFAVFSLSLQNECTSWPEAFLNDECHHLLVVLEQLCCVSANASGKSRQKICETHSILLASKYLRRAACVMVSITSRSRCTRSFFTIDTASSSRSLWKQCSAA